jgi:hypothetical protein
MGDALIEKLIAEGWKTVELLSDFKLKYHHRRISWILGENIFDHYLVKGNREAIEAIKRAKNLNQINTILEKRYNKTHTKKLSVPGKDRSLYRKYIGENHPDFVLSK